MPVLAELAEKRRARRKTIEADEDLSPLARTLVLGIHEHGDDMVDTMERGFTRLANLLMWVLGSVLIGGFVLALVLLLMFGQTKGVDTSKAADDAAKVIGATRVLAEEAHGVAPSAPPEK